MASSTHLTDADPTAEERSAMGIGKSVGSEPLCLRLAAHRYRYFILTLGMFCLTSVCSNMTTLNFTLICMDAPRNGSHETAPRPDVPTYDYSISEKSWLMWAVAIGSVIGTFPFNLLYSRYGAKWVFFVAGLLSAVSTLLIPLAAQTAFGWFIVARFVQGFAYAADFAAIGILCSQWASLKQNGFFVSVLTCFTPLASSITNPVAGALCESEFGWPSVYYVHGVACLVLFALWLFFYDDHPQHHPYVSEVECEKIHRNKTQAHINMDSFIPYRAICTDPVVLTVWLNALADIGSALFLFTYTPTYIKNVLNYGISTTGFLGALPALSHMPIKYFCGYFSDQYKGCSERSKLLFFNTLALAVPGLMYIGLGFVPDDQPWIAIVLFTGIYAFVGANGGGFYKCGTMISRQYSAFVVANIQFIKCLSLVIAPALVMIFITDDTSKAQWRNIFFVWAVSLFVANAVFCWKATDKPCEFTKITRDTVEEAKRTKHQITDSSAWKRNQRSC